MPRRGENIYRRKDGRWEARYIASHDGAGRAKYHYVYGSSYTEVREKKQAAQGAQSILPDPVRKKSATFCALADIWLNDIRGVVKESSYTRYHRILHRYLYPHFGETQLAKLGSRQLGGFPSFLLSEGGTNGGALSPKTVSDILCVLKSVLRYGKENGYPAPDPGLLRCPPQAQKPVQTVADGHRLRLEKLLLSSEGLTETGILFTLFTGVRIGELCGLRWEDIDLANATVHIQRTVERIADLDPLSPARTKVVIREPKTRSAMRDIPLPAFLVEYLRGQERAPGCYLLTGTDRCAEPHQYYMRYRKYLAQNGLGGHTFHALRHTFATRCVENGFDAKSLAEILGHARVSTTLSIYVHPTMQQKRIQMERLTPTHYSQSDF